MRNYYEEAGTVSLESIPFGEVGPEESTPFREVGPELPGGTAKLVEAVWSLQVGPPS